MIAILNTTILVSSGVFAAIPVSVLQARSLVRKMGYRSHVGHESTAKILTKLLGVSVAYDRMPFNGDGPALCFKLLGRAPEGTVLTVPEIEAIGFDLRMITPLGPIPKPGDRVQVADDARLFRGCVGPYGAVPSGDGAELGSIIVDVVEDEGPRAAYPLSSVKVVPR